jgi:hypothetical protein
LGIAQALDFQDQRCALTAFSQALKLADASSNRREIFLTHLPPRDILADGGWNDDANEFEDVLARARSIGGREEESALYTRGAVAYSELDAQPQLDRPRV